MATSSEAIPFHARRQKRSFHISIPSGQITYLQHDARDSVDSARGACDVPCVTAKTKPDRRAPRGPDGIRHGSPMALIHRRDLLKTGIGAAAAATLALHGILRAQGATRVGRRAPPTGFLGPLGDYGYKAAQMAVDEANAAGGALGRKVELISEDTPNPGVAVTKAQKLIERDKATFLLGEISSASGLAISEIAQRSKI